MDLCPGRCDNRTAEKYRDGAATGSSCEKDTVAQELPHQSWPGRALGPLPFYLVCNPHKQGEEERDKDK